MGAVIVTKCVDLASSPEALWPLITDTDRLNRLLGTGPLHLRPIEGGDSAARFVVETKTGGFTLQYEELPFEWSHARSFSVVRKMRGGPLQTYSMAFSFEPTTAARGGIEGGTRVSVRLEIVPRHWLFQPIAQFQAGRVVARVGELAEELDAHLRDHAPSPFQEPVAPVDEAHLVAAIGDLRKSGVRDDLATRVDTLLRKAPDADLVRIRPFELADQWGEDRRDVLRAMLRGVPAGLFELRWAIICPSCLTASEQYRALSEISAEGHCQLCDISFDLDLDRAVEATFFPHPSVRGSSDQLFCVGGPARTPHVLTQAVLEAREAKLLDAPREAGRYRVFMRGGASASVEVEPDAPAISEATVDAASVRPVVVRVAPGGSLRVTNATDESRHVKIERLGYASAAATAHVVSTLDDFRTLFSSELLKRSTPLKVAKVVILFSDLTGSTALYSKVGDAAAFRLVDDHFDVVRAAVAKHEGVIVKTMGDAVMAAFADTRHCVRAAVETLTKFEEFRRACEHGELVGIKLGMHAGACYVVTANGQLDYFGQTVNIASRVQHLAESGELVVGREHVEQLSGDELAGVAVTATFEACVKGVDGPLSLLRMRPTEGHGAGKVDSGAAELIYH